jgi:hypothetical protein
MPPAAFSHRSDPQRTPEGTPPVFTRCGLADSLFEHPAGPSSSSLCSQRPHDETVVSRCAQSKKEASGPLFCLGEGKERGLRIFADWHSRPTRCYGEC